MSAKWPPMPPKIGITEKLCPTLVPLKKLCSPLSPPKSQGPHRHIRRVGVAPPAPPPGRARRPRSCRGPSVPQSRPEGPRPPTAQSPSLSGRPSPAGASNSLSPAGPANSPQRIPFPPISPSDHHIIQFPQNRTQRSKNKRRRLTRPKRVHAAGPPSTPRRAAVKPAATI